MVSREAGILFHVVLISACHLALCGGRAAVNLSLCDTAIVQVQLGKPVNSSFLLSGELGELSGAEELQYYVNFRGRFGNHSPRVSLTSDVSVHVTNARWSGDGVNDRTGCSAPFENVPSQARQSDGGGADSWIAVLQRGGCTFAQKIENAMRSGASAVIIYNRPGQQLDAMDHYSQRDVLVVLIENNVGEWLGEALDNHSVTSISIYPQEVSTSRLDGVTIACACAMILPALLLNGAALASIMTTTKKVKPHVYLIVNLIVTDLQVAFVSAAQVGTLFGVFHEACADDDRKKPARCAASVLSRYWNVLLYSNMLTLLLLTAEHFVACRWPLRHKVLLTRQKVLAGVACSWILACLPDVVAVAVEAGVAGGAGDEREGAGGAGEGGRGGVAVGMMATTMSGDTAVTNYSQPLDFCEFLHRHSIGYEWWQASAVFVGCVTVLLSSLLCVYGYILWVIHTARIGKLEARRKRNAVVTSLLLLGSCCVSYVFHYMLQFSVAVERTADSSLVTSYRTFLRGLFPTSPLLIDYVLTGVLGAILDPLIYCSRTKEVKRFLTRFISMRHASSSGSGTAGAAGAATHVTHLVVVGRQQQLPLAPPLPPR